MRRKRSSTALPVSEAAAKFVGAAGLQNEARRGGEATAQAGGDGSRPPDTEDDRQLFEESLAPYWSLTKVGHPFAPIAREILAQGPSRSTLQAMRQALDLWPTSTLAALDALASEEGGRRHAHVIHEFLRLRRADAFHPSRRKTLSTLGYDTDLDERARRAATAEAEMSSRSARDAKRLTPRNVREFFDRAERAFFDKLNEAAAQQVDPGWRPRWHHREDEVDLPATEKPLASNEWVGEVDARLDIELMLRRFPPEDRELLAVMRDVVVETGSIHQSEAAGRLGWSPAKMSRRWNALVERVRSA
jgi:hypothetical protein